MVVVGGLTRLTESGLSIVEWKLVSGILPPLSDQAWQEELQAYRASPQYQQVNKGMSVEEFKHIFWLEYIHRLLGRLVGLTFALPLMLFWMRGLLPLPVARKMLLITMLVAVQGAVGWYMVSSGLKDVPWVSPLRLAFHLGLAAIIFCLLLHVLYTTQRGDAPTRPHPLFRLSCLASALVFLQILMGALVAGLDAGLTYNTWPLMDGAWIPPHLFLLEPLMTNFFEHIPLVQFQHRWVAVLVLTIIIYQHLRVMLSFSGSPITRVSWGILALVLVQFSLGVMTLVLVVPIGLATLHQAVALLLIGFCVFANHMLYFHPHNRMRAKTDTPAQQDVGLHTKDRDEKRDDDES